MYVNLLNAVDRINQYRKTKISNRNFLVIAAFVVGILAGCAAAILKSFIHHIENFLQNGFQWDYKYYLYLFFPLIGILMSVLYTRRFIRKGKFETGLTPVLFTIARKSSKVEPHNIYSQLITSGLTVGFGGSVGIESPIVTSGAGIGSAVGRFLGLSYRETTMLLACGAAAGIAGAFNSPIAGIVFAIEVLLPEFTIPAFIPLLLSAATAAVVARIFYSEQLFFLVTEGWQIDALPFYVVMALLVGGFCVYLTKVSYVIKGLFARVSHPYKKVLFGGLMLGGLVFVFPTLYGEGYVTIRALLLGNYASVINNSMFSAYHDLPFVIIIFTLFTIFAKSFATLITLAAGGNGGTFAPSLIMGGLIGFLFAFTVNTLGIANLNVPNFIVAGMAAALSGVMHSPLTGIFLIAELTGGYILMVPLMITSAISYFVSRSSSKYSMYTKPLAESGDLMSHEDKDTTVLNMMRLRYLVEKDYEVLNEDQLLSERMTAILNAKRNLFPVVDQSGSFKGLVYMEDIFRVTAGETERKNYTIGELMQMAPDRVSIDDSLKEVLNKMELENVWILPVLGPKDKFIGFVSKTAIFNKYRSLLNRQADYME